MTTATRDLITKLYVSYFDRAPDLFGLNYWVGQAKQNVSLETIADSFGGAQETKDKYTYLAFPNISDPAAFVNSIYVNAFGRQAETAGLTYWVNLLNTQGSGQASTFILTLIQSAGGADITALQNKITIASRFTNGLLNNNIISAPAQTFTDSTTILNSITSDPTSVTAGNTAVDTKIASYISAATVGTTTALTTSLFDNLIGTANNDTIAGANTLNASTTDLVQATDKIDGGAGIDTFQYIGAYNTAAVPTLSNVEKVELLNPSNNAIIDFTGKATGLQQVTIKGLSTPTLGALTVKGLSGISLGVEGATLTAVATPTTTITSLTADFGSTTTSANLSIKDAAVTTADLNTGTINAALTTLNIATDGLGKNSIPTLTLPAATTTLKITGAGTLDLGATTPTTVATIDASANTGGVKVAVGAVNTTFTGGSGNDTFSSTLANFDASDKLDGGAGTTDTLILTGLSATSTVPYAAINAVKNFEVLNLSGSGITVDASQLTAFPNELLTLTPTDGAIVVTGATATNTFTLAGTGSSVAGSKATSFALTGTGAATIALQDTATISALNLTGVTTLNIQSKKKDATTASNSITLGTGLGTATTSTVPIKVTGDSALTITQPTTSINVNIDATGFQGALTATGGGTGGTNTLTGGDGNDTLTGGGAGTTNILIGGNGNDSLIGGAGTNRLVAGLGRDVLTGAAGTDTFVFSIAGSNAASFSGPTADTYDTVNSFSQGTDKIELSGTGFNATTIANQPSVQAAVTGASTFSAALGSAATAIGASKFGSFTLGSDTYILGNDATVGTLNQGDLLIKLAGATTLSAGDFIFS